MKTFLKSSFWVSLIFSGMLATGWLYMLIISLFHPISYKSAFGISLFVNIVSSVFKQGQAIKNDN